MPPQTTATRWWRLGVIGYAGAIVSVASAVVNGLAYLVPVLAARLLPAAELGALATLVAIGAIAAVAGLGLQTALAVRWARAGAVPGANRVAVMTAGTAAGLLLLGTPVFALTLRLEPGQTALLALLTFPVVLAGRWLGELQGRERFGRLAAGMVLLAIARYGGLVAALAAGLGLTASLAIGAAGGWLSVGILRLLTAAHPAGDQDLRPLRGREVLRATGATLAMLAISYADLILARHALAGDQAGAYSVGSVLTKGALWAPGVVTVLALPRLARGSRHALRVALACVGLSGVVLVLASAVAGDAAVGLVGGPAYAGLGPYAAGFAAVGALYAFVFVFVNAEIAAGSRWPSAPLWIALGGLVATVELRGVRSVAELLTCSFAAALTTIIAMATIYGLRRRRPMADTAKAATAATQTAPAAR
jgi:O-antigen/teichoic acid export membrane protein